MDINELIFSRIQSLAKEKNIKVSELIALMGYSRTGYYAAQRNKSLKIETISTLAKALNMEEVSLFKYIFGEESANYSTTATLHGDNGKQIVTVNHGKTPDPNVVNEPAAEYQTNRPNEAGKYDQTYDLLRQCQEQNEAFRIAIKNMEKTIQLLEEKNKQG